jgi:hypothetical protein
LGMARKWGVPKGAIILVTSQLHEQRFSRLLKKSGVPRDFGWRSASALR